MASYSLWTDDTYGPWGDAGGVMNLANAERFPLLNFTAISSGGLWTKGNERGLSFGIAQVVVIELGYSDRDKGLLPEMAQYQMRKQTCIKN